jgi:hypothetical protein
MILQCLTNILIIKMHNLFCKTLLGMLVFLSVTLSAQEHDLKCVQITHIFPNLDNMGKIESYDTTTVTYYSYGNMRAYEFPYLYTHSTNGTLDSAAIKKRYFVHEKDSLNGRVFDSAFQIYNKRGNIDSVTMIRSFVNLHLKESFEQLKMATVSVVKDSISGTVEEVLKVWEEGKSGKMTWHMTYSTQFNDIPFSMSSYIDSIKGLKLQSFVIENPPVSIPSKQLNVDAFVNSYFMKRIPCPAESMIMKYIKLYHQ